MLGPGLIARPDLALQIAAARDGRAFTPMTWHDLRPLVLDFWQQARRKVAPHYVPLAA